MKILALEKEVPGVSDADFQPHLRAEAQAVWALVQADVVREVYFRQAWRGAVLILECRDAAEAGRALGQLPLVSAGLIEFEVIPLVPYSGFARLFGPGGDDQTAPC